MGNLVSQAILDSAVVGIVKVQDCHILWANRAFETMMGFNHGHAQGLPMRRLYARAEDYDTLVAQARPTMGAGGTHSTTCQLVRTDGKSVWATMHAILVDAEKNISVGIFLDITAHRQTEEALRIADIAFESQEGIFVTDANRTILRVNRAFSEITGYSAAETVGKTPRLLRSGRHDHNFYNALHKSLEEDGRWQGEIWNRRKNGELFPEWLTISVVRDCGGAVQNYVATLIDTSSKKATEDQIRNLAFYDPLTGLPNRRLLLDRLEHALAARSGHACEGALLLIDLDNFKDLNDDRGHHMGDLLLQQVGLRVADCVREEDTVARFGGDEFVVLMKYPSDDVQEVAAYVEGMGQRILNTLRHPFTLSDGEHHHTASIGVTLFFGHQNSMEARLRQADMAMYQAKAAGRNTLRFFDPLMQATVTARAALEAGLREALQQQQFRLYYQPQVEGEGHLRGAEALVRWQHPQRGMVSPLEFIALAEETGLILPLGQWVLEVACAQLARWGADPKMAHLTLSVNVSARQFKQVDFVEQVLSTLQRTGANPRRLKLELTESLLVTDVENTIAKMMTLKASGIGFSLDDFGTGYSSLSYLKRLPLDQLKIDQSFVREGLTDANGVAIAKMVIALGGSLGLAVIAEGVETAAQRQLLASEGCQHYQGYLFSKPLPLEDFEAMAASVALSVP